jgi:glutamyl-tRNA reductase
MPLSSLLCLSLSHKAVPQDLRAQVALGADRAGVFGDAAQATGLAGGLVVLSTCGRTELYADVRGRAPRDARAPLLALLAGVCEVDAPVLDGLVVETDGMDAARHAARVAAGLESAVPGEPEILGQVTTALAEARTAGRVSTLLRRVFEAAIRAGRRARRETAINRGATGLGALPAKLAARHFGALRDRHAIVVGTGEMGQAALTSFWTHGTGRLTVVNRTLPSALSLANRVGGQAACLHGFRALLPEADIVVTATASEVPLVDRALVEQAVAGRAGRPLFIADLGLPRNVSGDVAGLCGVTLHDLDALKRTVHATLDRRQQEVPRVEAIIEQELEALVHRERHAAAEPTVRALRREAERIRRETLDRTLQHLPGLDEATRQHVEFLTRSLVNGLLRHPTETLRHAAAAGEGAPLAEAARTLFALGAAEETRRVTA